MTEHNGNGNIPPENDDLQFNVRPDADQGREPKLIPGHLGTRQFSMAALVERIVSAFDQEHSFNSPALLAAVTRTDKLKLLRDTVNYVLAVESIIISAEDQAELMRQTYAELFTYGALDAFFADPSVTTITLEGIDKVAIRYGHGELVSHPPIFDDHEQLRRMIHRLLKDAGTTFQTDQPYIETGLTIEGRPVCINLVLPPVTPLMSVDLRVHPAELPALETMVESEQAQQLLTAIAQSSHGFVVVGEAESGKTTLLAILANLSNAQGIISVERAGELHLPGDTKQLMVQWANGDQPGITFGEQINTALNESPSCVILDEVRADEPQAVVPLLKTEQPIRQMWAFRGQADSKRLSSALGMLARRGDASQSEALVRSLYERLPFVIVMRRRKDRLQLHSISEWQFPPDTDYPNYVELMAQGWESIELTGNRPAHDLALPDDFWKAKT